MVEVTSVIELSLRSPQYPGRYYHELKQLAGEGLIFHDNLLQALVIGKYSICMELLRDTEALLRPSPVPRFPGVDSEPRVRNGLDILNDMLFFSRGGAFLKRKRLAQDLIDAKLGGLDVIVSELDDRLLSKIDRAGLSHLELMGLLREYMFGVSARMALGTGETIPWNMMPDVMRVVYLLDGKKFSTPFVFQALHSLSVLASFVTYGSSSGPMVPATSELSDKLMLWITANESTPFLVLTYLSLFGKRPSVERDEVHLRLLECLRFDPPVQMVKKILGRDLTVPRVCGQLGEARCYSATKGQPVYLHLGLANRDVEIFDRPEWPVLGRHERPLSFGFGYSKCLGSSFAMIIARRLVSMFSRVSVDVELKRAVWGSGYSARGVISAVARVERL